MIVLSIFLSIFFLLFLLLLMRKDHTVSIEELREEMSISRSSFFEFNKVRCHYTDEGVGEVVIMIHGLGDSFRIFDDFASEVVKHYRVIRLDLPGFGLSDVPSQNQVGGELIDFYARCFSAFLKELDIDQLHLIGNSLGGWVSWHWASNHSEQLQSLTLLASAGFELERVKKNITQGVLEHIPFFLLKKGMPASFAQVNLRACIYNKDLIHPHYIRNNYRMINKRGTLQFMFELLESKVYADPGRLAAISCPVLVVWGSKDRIAPASHAKLFEEYLTKCKVVMYDKCGHYPQIERRDDLLTDWNNFVQS